ncbi:MAG: transglutaminase-like domain-containing protein [Dehalococcoidales bacterium]|nr:transglutaminase-like domain-containing protein [Dehalococcoidales bacterium]
MNRILKLISIVVILISISVATIGWYNYYLTKKKLSDTSIQLSQSTLTLEASEENLNNTKTLLNTTQMQLINTESQLIDIQAQLSVIEITLDTAEKQLETEKTNNSTMLNQYASLKQEINSRLALTQEDEQSFITPNNSSVSAKVLEITGGYSGDVNDYWKDCEKLYQWIVTNVTYSYDSYTPLLPEYISGKIIWGEEYWRMPEETLEDKHGDCEDMAILLASMLLNYNKGEYTIWVIGIRSEESGHLAVAFPVQDGNLTILDPAGNYYTSQFGSLESSNVSTAVNNWLYHWQREMPGAKIIKVFSEDIHEEFYNTEEFIAWVKNR